jgi:hypothetical protein
MNEGEREAQQACIWSTTVLSLLPPALPANFHYVSQISRREM